MPFNANLMTGGKVLNITYDEHTEAFNYAINSAKQIFEKYQRKQGILYHYTDITSLFEILKNQELWLSRCDFLNDSLEINYTYELFKEILDQKGLLNVEPWKDFHDIFTDFHKVTHVFILSLSLDKDSLQLWSNYSNSEGYNIGFDITELHNILFNEQLFFEHSEVIYNKDIQCEILSNIIDNVSNCIKKIGYTEFNQELYSKMSAVGTVLNGASVFFKHPYFKGEKEYRLIIFKTKGEPKHYIPKDLPPIYNAKGNQIEVFYRPRRNAIIPYIKIPIATSKGSHCIKEIRIGPKNNINIDLIEKGLTCFLEDKKYQGIKITKPDVSLRF